MKPPTATRNNDRAPPSAPTIDPDLGWLMGRTDIEYSQRTQLQTDSITTMTRRRRSQDIAQST
ncbi:Hypothetical predicted protein [Pelobates cultripes]|uniref:Uncharacterized protein n=1 Tax=Pelobates cultripes TaxID=61616 RepID=A0AAD1VUB1_PELCU|nr:Hypothetical predicted protein [Pelobates cultripes]